MKNNSWILIVLGVVFLCMCFTEGYTNPLLRKELVIHTQQFEVEDIENEGTEDTNTSIIFDQDIEFYDRGEPPWAAPLEPIGGEGSELEIVREEMYALQDSVRSMKENQDMMMNIYQTDSYSIDAIYSAAENAVKAVVDEKCQGQYDPATPTTCPDVTIGEKEFGCKIKGTCVAPTCPFTAGNESSCTGTAGCSYTAPVAEVTEDCVDPERRGARCTFTAGDSSTCVAGCFYIAPVVAVAESCVYNTSEDVCGEKEDESGCTDTGCTWERECVWKGDF